MSIPSFKFFAHCSEDYWAVLERCAELGVKITPQILEEKNQQYYLAYPIIMYQMGGLFISLRSNASEFVRSELPNLSFDEVMAILANADSKKVTFEEFWLLWGNNPNLILKRNREKQCRLYRMSNFCVDTIEEKIRLGGALNFSIEEFIEEFCIYASQHPKMGLVTSTGTIEITKESIKSYIQ